VRRKAEGVRGEKRNNKKSVNEKRKALNGKFDSFREVKNEIEKEKNTREE
jgi:hypothetical protein